MPFSDFGFWRELASANPSDGLVRSWSLVRPSTGRKQTAELDGERLRGRREPQDVKLGFKSAAKHQQEGVFGPQRIEGKNRNVSV
jgi:hypothetical protein